MSQETLSKPSASFSDPAPQYQCYRKNGDGGVKLGPEEIHGWDPGWGVKRLQMHQAPRVPLNPSQRCSFAVNSSQHEGPQLGSALNDTSLSHPFFPKLRNRSGKILRATGSEGLQQSSVSHAQQGSCPCELTAVVTVCTGSSHRKPKLGEGGRQEVPPLARQLMAVYSC